MKSIWTVAILFLGAAIAPARATAHFSFASSVANRFSDFAASELSRPVPGSLSPAPEFRVSKSMAIPAAATPEPASFLLVGLALVGVSVGMRRIRAGKAERSS